MLYDEWVSKDQSDLESADADGQFQPIAREPTLSDKVTEMLLRRILAGKMKPGDRLPSERELGEQFGVSRTVVREAVRSLAAKGVIDIQMGSGIRIAAVEAERVSESMRLYIQGNSLLDEDGRLRYQQIHDVREMIETRVAVAACDAATADDLKELRSVHEEMARSLDDSEMASKLDVEFHRTIAVITQNPLYVIMLDSIGDVLLEIRRMTLDIPARPERALRFHARILEAIERRDGDAALEAMEAHLDDSKAVWTDSQ